MITGRLRQDEDCHWYLLPDLEVAAFDYLSTVIEGLIYTENPKAYDEFEKRFSKFRIDGYQNVEVIVERG